MSRRGDRRARVGAGRHDRLDAEHVGGSRSSHLLRGIDAQNAHDSDRARNLAHQDSRRSLNRRVCDAGHSGGAPVLAHSPNLSPAPGRIGIASGGRL
jgi:hypothetical protein